MATCLAPLHRVSAERPTSLARARAHARELDLAPEMSCGCSSRGSDRLYGLQQSMTGEDRVGASRSRSVGKGGSREPRKGVNKAAWAGLRAASVEVGGRVRSAPCQPLP